MSRRGQQAVLTADWDIAPGPCSPASAGLHASKGRRSATDHLAHQMVRVPATVVPLHSPWERIEQAFGARPTGFKRADDIYILVPIEGREDWIRPASYSA